MCALVSKAFLKSIAIRYESIGFFCASYYVSLCIAEAMWVELLGCKFWRGEMICPSKGLMRLFKILLNIL